MISVMIRLTQKTVKFLLTVDKFQCHILRLTFSCILLSSQAKFADSTFSHNTVATQASLKVCISGC